MVINAWLLEICHNSVVYLSETFEYELKNDPLFKSPLHHSMDSIVLHSLHSGTSKLQTRSDKE